MRQFRFGNILLILIIFSLSCRKTIEKPDIIPPVIDSVHFIKACDISFLPLIRTYNTVFYNREGTAEDMLTTMKKNGVNTIRLRLWNNPADGHSGFEEVLAFSNEIKTAGFKTWLTLHYSDTWADPGNQTKPAFWEGITFEQLKDSVYTYTAKVCLAMKPDYIQIGNEINGGLLWPEGKYDQHEQMKALLSEGIKAVRNETPATKIMLHYAGHQYAVSFFTALQSMDYDIAAISYYPIWHGKDLPQLESNLRQLKQSTGKNVVIAETAYPFTLDWNDWTNNIVGLEDQLLDGYPASPEGQLAFLNQMHQIVSNVNGGVGICWWGAEWVAYRGQQADNGSSWENQALWDFENKALPAIEAFNPEQ